MRKKEAWRGNLLGVEAAIAAHALGLDGDVRLREALCVTRGHYNYYCGRRGGKWKR